MLEEMVMAKVDATQAAMLSGMAGNSYTVGQVTTTGNGLGTWLFLSPDGGAAGQGVMAVKLEGTRQMAQMSGLVGKSVTVGKAPTVVGGMGKWIVLYPKAALAAKGAAAAGAAGLGASALADSQLIMLKLEGTQFAAQTPYLAGKTFTVVKTTAATAGGTGKWLFLQPVGGVSQDLVALKVQNGAAQMPWLVGKTFTIGKAPIIAGANASKYLVLQPAAGLAAKGVAGVSAAATGVTAATKGVVPTMKTIALQTAGTGTTTVAATAAAGTAAAGTVAAGTAVKGVAAGTIWTGTGTSLGLGLGLGMAGPVILGAIVAAAGYGVYRYRKSRAVSPDADEALMEAIS